MDFHIIIPTYNRKNLLKRSIDSVINQKTSVNYFIYIIDDGSIDGTKDFINKNYKKENIFYFYKENGGVCSARNYGLKEVLKKGNKDDFILFLDSDDELTKNSLNLIFKRINSDYEIKYFGFGMINNKLQKLFKIYDINDNILNFNHSLGLKKSEGEFFRIIKIDILLNLKIFFPEDYNGGEFLFWNEINRKYYLKLYGEVVYIYYQDDKTSITRDLLNQSKINNFLKVTKLFIDNYGEDLYNLNKKNLGLHYLVYARMLSLSGKRMESFSYGFKGLYYSKDLSRFILYFLSILPYGIRINNFILKVKK